MKIVYNKIVPFKGFSAINLFGVVFARKECKPLPDRVVNHEDIHTAQMRELFYVFFYILYVAQWLMLLIKYQNTNQAYYNISFEREAYANEDNIEYLKNRKLWGWIEY